MAVVGWVSGRSVGVSRVLEGAAVRLVEMCPRLALRGEPWLREGR